MQNYSEWLNNKLYEGHVKRLTEIKEKDNKTIQVRKNFRVKSQPSKSQTNIKGDFLPLPLVSRKERLLLGSVVKLKTINLREKQSLLENYLLSKRILQTNSVFDSKLLKKQFNFHKKVSENMNRNLKQNRKTFSSLRNKKYSELQRLKEDNCLGTGKISFKLKINEIMMIKRRIEDNSESKFNLIFKPQKFKSYQAKALSFTDLIAKWHQIRATEKQVSRKNGLKFQIQEVRGNEVHQLGEFRVNISIKSEQRKQSSQTLNPQKENIQKQTKEKQAQYIKIINIEKFLHPVTKFLIGTVNFSVYGQKMSSLSTQD